MAKTASQLQTILGEYVAPGKPFYPALEQVLARLHDMGTWKDMTFECSITNEYGYGTLPPDADSVLACVINNRPRPVRSIWHDVRITGRTATVSAYYGSIDDGWHPVMLEMRDVQGVACDADVVATDVLRLVLTGTTAYPANFTGSVTLTTNAVNDGGTLSTEVTDHTTYLSFDVADDFTRVVSIAYTDIEVPLDIIDPDFPTKVIATIPAGSGVCRFRRFRMADKHADTRTHFLVSRAAPDSLTDSTVVHLSNLGALKRGLLAVIAEDNSDLDTAEAHWAKCEEILDKELASVMGAAKPTLQWNDVGAIRVQNQY